MAKVEQMLHMAELCDFSFRPEPAIAEESGHAVLRPVRTHVAVSDMDKV
jgi:hypothetical protein